MSQDNPGANRFSIAKLVLLISGAAILLTSAIALIAAIGVNNQTFLQTSDRVFTSILPLVSTWVGTVMAFYFSKDNFDAAQQSVRDTYKDMFQDRLKSKKVEEVMIPFEKITGMTIDPDDDGGAGKIKILEHLIKKLEPGKVTRIPIFSKSKLGKYIIHESYLYKYISQIPVDATIKPETATFKDFLNHEENGKKYGDLMTGAVVFVSLNDSLSEAKEKIEAQGKKNAPVGCQDAFVTEDGNSTSPVLGWLSNSDVLKVIQG
ncbi:MAG: hypothetical protein VW455_06105 [Nitrospinota bacterium]